MSADFGAIARGLIQAALRDGLSWNEMRSAVAEAGVRIDSTVASREWQFAQGLNDLAVTPDATIRDLVPTADKIVDSPISWESQFMARVQFYGRDLETGQFAHRWTMIPYNRLPAYGDIEQHALLGAVTSPERYGFEVAQVTAITVERSSSYPI